MILNPELQSIFQAWLKSLEQQKRFSPHTILAYRRDFQEFVHFLGNHRGEKINLEILETLALPQWRSWLAGRKNRQLSTRSTARALSVMRNFYNYLHRHHGLENLSISLIKAPRLHIGLPRPLAEGQALELIDHISSSATKAWIGQRDKALFTLLYGAGLRVGEALSLNRACLPLGKVLVITGKGQKQRQVPLLPIIAKEVSSYIDLCPFIGDGSFPLFIGEKGKKLQASVAQKVLRDYRRLYGLPESLTPHALRHSFATHMMAGSRDLRAVQELLGHASPSTTQVYTHIAPEFLKKVYAACHPRHNKKP